MDRPPRDPRRPLLDTGILARIGLAGGLIGVFLGIIIPVLLSLFWGMTTIVTVGAPLLAARKAYCRPLMVVA